MNLIGIVHGGVTSSLLDNAMGMAVMLARPKDKVVTTNLNAHFVSPLKEGPLFVTAEVVHESRKIITATGRVTDEYGIWELWGWAAFASSTDGHSRVTFL
ncbi:PaaI family thioesterase [Paenibacillus larvae]|uniref:PaaI family thioesterase n=1 Tax=Paenibacillus larvae TaxID=1464 RepID=UPI0028F44B84|nr:PaaI family thioesterase [Paenibacillus larvae]